MWTEKYRPKKIKDVIGQESATSELLKFVLKNKVHRRADKKSVILYGPSGTGKTSAAYALASELGYELIEINASDFRNKMQIDNVVGKALSQRSLFAKAKIIVVDELEGISGDKDRGGILEIGNLIMESFWPIILITSKPFDKKLKAIRNNSELIQFKKLDSVSITKILQKICQEEGIEADYGILRKIASNALGDARAAINDLCTASVFSGKKIEEKDFLASEREKEQDIFNALRIVFKSKSASTALGAFDNVDMDLDEIFLWIDENLPKEYRSSELAMAYDKLSRADVFKGRIRRQQYWNFLPYIYALITAGIAVSKKKVNEGFMSYKPTSRLLKIWIENRTKKVTISQKYAKVLHCSKKKARAEMPYLSMIYSGMLKNKQPTENLNKQLGLDNEEIEYLSSI